MLRNVHLSSCHSRESGNLAACALFSINKWIPALAIMMEFKNSSLFKTSLRTFAYLILAACLLPCQFAHAELLPVPALKARVTDLTQTLSSAQQAQLEQKLAAFEQEKGSQIAVLIVPSTQPEDIAQYSIRVTDIWKLGRKGIGDGVLMLIAKGDRKMRIEVGRGLEGAIPDLYAKRIVSEILAPRFKQGDFYGGIDAATQKLIGLVNGEALPAPTQAAKNGGGIGSLLPLLLFGGLISGMMLRGMFGTFFGSALNGGLLGGLVWILGLALGGAAILGVLAFVVTMMLGGRGANSYGGLPSSGGYGGGWSGGGSSWGGGGGGDFGGGGASGDW